MDLIEAQGKELFSEYHLPIPEAYFASSILAATKLAKRWPTAVLKAQVPAGHRKKLGGIVMVTQKNVRASATKLFKKKIAGFPVRAVLVEQHVDIEKEWYLALTLDRTQRALVLLFSAKGGIDIEDLAQSSALKRFVLPLKDQNWAEVAHAVGIKYRTLVPQLKKVVALLERLLRERDATLVEVNPLVVTRAKKILLLDSKVTLDDAALYRQSWVKAEPQKNVQMRAAASAGVSYVPLDGSIGIIGNGAGLVMATLDAVAAAGGRPANFLDVGGGADRGRMAAALSIVLSQPGVKKLLINIFGGITRTDEIAHGILTYRRAHRVKTPFVVRLVGNREEQARKILKRAGIEAYTTMREAVTAIVKAKS